VPGSVTYTVERTQGGAVHAIASGLTLPNFTDAPTENGTVEYSVKAVNSNGTSARSSAGSVTITQVPVARMAMPH